MKFILPNRKRSYKKHGVYIIKNNINDKVYIGSAICLYTRSCQHKGMLENKKHKNPKLTNFVKKYYDNVEFYYTILEYVKDKCELIEREQYYLNTYLKADEYINNKNKKEFYNLGFNNRAKAESNLGIKLKQSPEFLEFQRNRFIEMNKNSVKRKEVYKKIAESNRGRKCTQREIDIIKARSKGELNANSKISDEEVLFIRYLYEKNSKISPTLIGLTYNITPEQVHVIKNKKQRSDISYTLKNEDIIKNSELLLKKLSNYKEEIIINYSNVIITRFYNLIEILNLN